MIMENSRIKVKIVKSYYVPYKVSPKNIYLKIKALKKGINGEDLSGEDEDALHEDRHALQDLRDRLSTSRTKVYEIKVRFKRYNYTAHIEMRFHQTEKPTSLMFANALKRQIRDVLNNYRRSLKRLDMNYACRGHMFKATGPHVFSEPNQIYAIFVKKKIKELYNEKLPDKTHKYIGLELEFCAPVKELDLSLILFEAGIHKYGQLKKDGSLRPKPGETGFELALLLPESHYKKNLKTVCQILNKLGAKTDDRRCGVHVHLDMRRRKKDIVYNNLVACQDILFKFIDPIRRNNEFCHTVESRKFPTHFNNDRHERYKSINAAAFYKYKTLEIRMHEGSVNFNDLSHWMQLLIKIGNHRTKIKNDIRELTTLKKRFNIDKKMGEFFQDKTCFWQLKNERRDAAVRHEWAIPVGERVMADDILTPRTGIAPITRLADNLRGRVAEVTREELVATFGTPNNDDQVPF